MFVVPALTKVITPLFALPDVLFTVATAVFDELHEQSFLVTELNVDRVCPLYTNVGFT